MSPQSRPRWPQTAAAVLVVASSTFNSVTGDAIIAALPVMARELGRGGNAAFLTQMIAVAPAISIMIGAPLAGFLARRVALHRLLLPLMLVYILAGGYGMFAHDRNTLILSRLVLGLASGLLGPLAMTRVVEIEPSRQATLLGLGNAVSAATAIASYVGGGWLTEAFGWRSANVLHLWPLVLAPFALPGSMAERRPLSGTSNTERVPFAWGRTLPFYILTIVIFSYIYIPPLLGPFILNARGMTNAGRIGLAISFPALVCVLIAPCYGGINRRLAWQDQLVAIVAFLTIAATGLSFTREILPTTIVMAVIGLGGGLCQPMIVACLIRRVDRSQIPTAYGIFAAATYLSVFLAPPFYKAITLVSPLQPQEGLAVIGGVALASLVVWRLAGRIAAGRIATAPQAPP